MNETGTPTALIAGGSGDIGRAIAARLGGLGYRLVLAARDEQRLREAAAALDASGHAVETHRCDLTQDAEIDALVQAVLESTGRIDVLVNAAGVSHGEIVLRSRRQSWDDMLATNLVGAALLCKAVLKGMRRRKTGYIIQIGSVAGREGIAGRAAYSASKAGLRAMGDSLRAEARNHGVRVSTISPGMVDTRMHGADNAEAGRMLRPADVAEAVAFLLELSPNAAVHELLLDTNV